MVEVKHTLEALHLRNKALAEADARYIRELDNAKTTIEELELNVATGRQRLQLAATCPRVPPAAPPPAWMMVPPRDLLMPLNRIILPSEAALQRRQSR
ncbi:lysis system i-spanin subunit Rz [Apirhabdus apintestini]|nr:lysis system i-spanin subunit Rz [Enterobacteriaceae bacterium CA-0114]